MRSRGEVRLPVSIKRAAELLARADGVSLNRWIAFAVARKVGGTKRSADFFKRRAKGGSQRDLIAVLAKVKNRMPDPRDRR